MVNSNLLVNHADHWNQWNKTILLEIPLQRPAAHELRNNTKYATPSSPSTRRNSSSRASTAGRLQTFQMPGSGSLKGGLTLRAVVPQDTCFTVTPNFIHYMPPRFLLDACVRRTMRLGWAQNARTFANAEDPVANTCSPNVNLQPELIFRVPGKPRVLLFPGPCAHNGSGASSTFSRCISQL